MKRRKIILLASALISVIAVATIATMMPSYSSPSPQLEPASLKDLVEFATNSTNSRNYNLTDLEGSQRIVVIDNMMLQVGGFEDIMAYLEGKGYPINLNANATVSRVHGSIEGSIFSGYVLSCWSTDGPNGTRAYMAAALMDDGDNITFCVQTNLSPPKHVADVPDPFIIVNAMPYIFIDWYWWVWPPWSRIVSWEYWWYDSHSHPNWFWGCYWWWRTYVRSYIGIWRPWWWWWWHWIYWRHWYWWSAYFPW